MKRLTPTTVYLFVEFAASGLLLMPALPLIGRANSQSMQDAEESSLANPQLED